MSALDNYIHRSYENYKKYGTNKEEDGPSNNLTSAIREQRALNKKRLDRLMIKANDANFQKALEELKNRASIDSNLNTNNEKGNLNTEYIDKLKAISENMKSDFIDRLIASLTKGQITKNDSALESTAIADVNRIRQELIKSRKKIEELIKKINLEINTSDKNSTEELINQLLDEYNKFYDIINRENQKAYKNYKSFSGIKNWGLREKDLSQNSILVATQKAIDNVTLSEVSANLKGAFGEKLIALCDDSMRKTLGKDVSKFLEKIQKEGGQARSEFRITHAELSPEIAQTMNKEYGLSKRDPNGNLYQIHYSQDKVDATIKVNGIDLATSIKAYTPDSKNTVRPHLQDVNLFYSLTQTASNFGQHWLNLQAHGRDLKAADNALQEHMAYEALVYGNLLKKNQTEADSFVYIDITTGKVYTFAIGTLLKQINNFTFDPSIAALAEQRLLDVTYNGWHGLSLNQRLAAIINTVKQTKISVGYRLQFKQNLDNPKNF